MNKEWQNNEIFFNCLNQSNSISQLFRLLGYNSNGIHQRTIDRFNKYYNCDIRKQIEENKKNYKLNRPKEIHICKNCGKEFTEKYSKYSDGNFCCRKCASLYSHSFCSEESNKKVSEKLKEYYKTHIHPHKGKKFPQRSIYFRNLKEQKQIEWICPICGKILKLLSNEAKNKKFCSGTCRNKYNNQYINGSRSKAEILLYDRLLKEYPFWNIISNDRKVLNGLELDIYIPKINFAIEWNGVYHYKNIRNNLLEQVQEKDKKKVKLCQQKKIDLYVVKDLTSHKKFIDNEIENIVKYINKKYIGV